MLQAEESDEKDGVGEVEESADLVMFCHACQSSTRRTFRISGMLSFISGFLLLSSIKKSARAREGKERTSLRPFSSLCPHPSLHHSRTNITLNSRILGLILAEALHLERLERLYVE